MPMDITELRKGERFIFTEPLLATFSAIEVSVVNISLGGVQIMHPHLLRLGTHGHLHFRHEDGVVNVTGRVLWSHMAQTEAGMMYRSGITLDSPDQQFAVAINAYFRAGVIYRDGDSLERKRLHLKAREERRKSQPNLTPVVLPPLSDPPSTT